MSIAATEQAPGSHAGWRSRRPNAQDFEENDYDAIVHTLSISCRPQACQAAANACHEHCSNKAGP